MKVGITRGSWMPTEYERDQKGRQDTGQEVEICFNFVGKFIPPTLKETEPTPKELEALRQKEERRQRMERFRRRKAQGLQDRYLFEYVSADDKM